MLVFILLSLATPATSSSSQIRVGIYLIHGWNGEIYGRSDGIADSQSQIQWVTCVESISDSWLYIQRDQIQYSYSVTGPVGQISSGTWDLWNSSGISLMSSCTSNSGSGNMYSAAYNLIDLTAGTNYTFTVTGMTSDGSFSATSTFKTLGANPTPTPTNIILTNPIGYSALVATGQNTFVPSSNGNFGLLLKGQTKTLNNSVILNNTGDIPAKVEARFNDSISGVFGLISGANLLNATNFALGQSDSLVSLDNNGTDVQIVTVPQGVTVLDARLGVPSEQVAGGYSGTVVLTFSNDV